MNDEMNSLIEAAVREGEKLAIHKPAAWLHCKKCGEVMGVSFTKATEHDRPLYAAPVATPVMIVFDHATGAVRPLVPHDMVMVPREPTREMVEAGNSGFRSSDSRQHTVAACYRAMIAAAEKAEKPPCDMGALCLGCEPRNPDGSCPDAQAKAAEALELIEDR